jgi:hypothetical protein
MRRLTILPVAVGIVFCLGMTPVFAQHGGGRPAGAGAPSGVGMGAPSDVGRGIGRPSDSIPSHSMETPNNSTGLSHSSPSDVLSHNTAIAGKITSLTGEDAQTACNGFKNLGQCVAAAHVAKNLNIPGGFDALKAQMTGTNAVSLGKAIQTLAPNADPKNEAKKASKQASNDLTQS